MGNSINISPEEYQRLTEADNKLDALEAAGVNNWEGYDEAMDILSEKD